MTLILVGAQLAGLLAGSATPAHAQDAQCQALAPALNENIVLRASGTYCLSNDLRIEKGWNLPDAHSSRPDKALVIAADDVVLDLQRHAIDAGNKAAGITMSNERQSEPQRVTIRNGTLRTERSVGVDAGFGSISIASDRDFSARRNGPTTMSASCATPCSHGRRVRRAT